ncbi:Histidine kinase/HSP90-like ATPase [Gracilaria domingensis]|nr:Histidine kinase/HSP90-like ATPase [Gracilaria domingensis]
MKNQSSSSSSSSAPKSKKVSSKVSILPLEVVQRIASGEVICGYESVLQELVENAIDAEADKVAVDIDIQSRSITVEDNGIGVSISDGLLDVARCNATTKLCSLEQLEKGVDTLGFRGQGLWSIAATAQLLTISSRAYDNICGTTVSFGSDGAPHMTSVADVPMNTGTIVRAIDLPWRLSTNERRRMIRNCKEWLIRTSLCHPRISFYSSRNGSPKWNSATKPREPQQQRMHCLAAQFQCSVSEFRSASVSIPDIGSLSLVIGLPSAIHSSSRAWVITAVNGRCVDLDWIKRTVFEAIQVPRSRYPVAFLHLEVDSQNVNWNISPKKTVMRFKNESMESKIKEACLFLIREALHSNLLPYTDEETVPVDAVVQSRDLTVSAKLGRFLEKLHDQEEAKRQTFDQDSRNPALFNVKVIGQVLNTYLLIEYNSGILLIEQHIADERAIYERLLRLWDESRFEAPEHETVLPSTTKEEYIFSLTSLGIVIDSCDDNTTAGFHVKAVPTLLARLPSSKLVPILLRLGAEAQTLEDAAASLSCQLAVRNGKPLNERQMKKITSELLKCDNPHTCPHGRPIFINLQSQELAKLFGRTWVPDRSNGEPLRPICFQTNSQPYLSSRVCRGILKE